MNYFNYFTEIEERFQQARGRQIYLCPLDWALIESWKEAGIPLAAALEGIDQTFAAFQAGRRKDSARPRSLAYCAPAVLKAAETAREAAVGGRPAGTGSAAQETGFDRARIVAFLRAAREQAAAAPMPPAAAGLVQEALAALEVRIAEFEAATAPPALEEQDRWLSALDDRLFAALQVAAPVALLAELRGEYERELAPYRRKLKTEQLAMVERQFLHKRLLERFRMPRFSLFYMP